MTIINIMKVIIMSEISEKVQFLDNLIALLPKNIKDQTFKRWEAIKKSTQELTEITIILAENKTLTDDEAQELDKLLKVYTKIYVRLCSHNDKYYNEFMINLLLARIQVREILLIFKYNE